MDRGAFAEGEITITPAENGSYLIRRDWRIMDGELYYPRSQHAMVCFSNYVDLLNFLGEEYRVANSPASIDMGQREA